MSDFFYNSAPSAWYSLLWKDTRQVLPMLAALAIGCLGVQLLGTVIIFLLQPPSGWPEAALGLSLTLTCVGPFLGIIVTCAMLVGHERQSGSWLWSSTLPQSWQRSLASKVAIVGVSCCAVAILLLLVPIFLWLFAANPGTFQTMPASEIGWASATILILLSGLCASLLLAGLLIEDSIKAILTAVCGLIFAQAALLACVGDSRLHIALASAALVGFLIAAVCITYQQRWQRIPSRGWFSSNAASAPTTQTLWAPHALWATQRFDRYSEWQMMLRLALRSNLGLRLTILGFALLGAACSYDFAMATVLASLTFGATTFANEKTRRRVSFLSDRGANPMHVYASQLIVSLFFASFTALACVTIAANSLQQPTINPLFVASAFGMSFSMGFAASICFSQAIIAWIVAFVWVLAACVLYGNTVGGSETARLKFDWLFQNAFVLLAISCILLFPWSYRRMVEWMSRGDRSLAKKFIVFTTSAFCLALLLSASLSFLLIENKPWPGLPLDELAPAITVSAPDFESDNALFSDLTSLNNEQFANLLTIGTFVSSLDDNSPDDATKLQESSATLTKFLDAIEDELKSPPKTITLPVPYADHINRALDITSDIALFAGVRDPELALRAWHINRRLRELPDPLCLTLPRRLSSLTKLSNLEPTQLARLAEAGDLLKLVDYQEATTTWAVEERLQRLKLTISRESLRTRMPLAIAGRLPASTYKPMVWQAEFYQSPLTYFPPVRWRIERELAANFQVSASHDSLRLAQIISGFKVVASQFPISRDSSSLE